MRDVDSLLLSGAQPEGREAARRQPEAPRGAEAAEAKSQSVVADIDGLIKLAKSKQQSGGGG
jgi:hypothetical protein